MGAEFLWQLATEGDGGDPSTAHPAHWIAVARAAEFAGLHALQVPSGPARPDAWVVAALLAHHTRRLQFLVGLRPGFVLPAHAAQQVASLQALTGNRLRLSLFAGGDIAEHRAHGDLVNHDDRFARAAEFLAVVKQVWRGRPGGVGQHHEGVHFRLRHGGLVRPLRDVPPIHLGGSSPAALRVAAEHADVYTLWADSPEGFGTQVAHARTLAASAGRRLRIACRVHLHVDDTEVAAWAQAQRALDRAAPSAPPARDLLASPQVWAGHGHVRTPGRVRPGTALVGSFRQVAARLEALHRLGADTFVLSAPRGLEDLLRVAEDVLPLVRDRGAAAPAPAPASDEEEVAA